ncbi:MAG TPA: hypothetical protein VGI93_19385 [Steroidobacteraceae bacterium]|jgi:hypothetical protein
MRVTLERVEAIARGLCDCTFPASEFHHREHILAGAYLMKSEPQRDWSQEFPELIKRFNLANGGANTDEAGYHDTITQFFLDALKLFLAQAPHDHEEAFNALLESPLADKGFPLRFYRADFLFSKEARRKYLAPDLKPLTLKDVL